MANDPQKKATAPAKTGAVAITTVLEVLQKNGIAVTADKDRTILAKGTTVESHIFGTLIHRQMLHYLSRKFGIPVHLFYRPEFLQ